jgi:hypothetical protein
MSESLKTRTLPSVAGFSLPLLVASRIIKAQTFVVTFEVLCEVTTKQVTTSRGKT